MQRSWMKWGIGGAITYTCAHILFLVGAYCAFVSSGLMCSSIVWSSEHLFLWEQEWFESVLTTISLAIDLPPQNPIWLGGMIFVDLLIGFVLGSLAAFVLNAQQPRKS